MTDLPDETRRFLHATTLQRQRDGRVPGLVAAVVRDGEPLWWEGVGVTEVGPAGEERVPGLDDQFLVASNTKTFTAVMVMQLRDEGRLTLDDLLGQHLPEVADPVTVRQALAHVSGMAREPVGDIWDTLVQPTEEELLANFDAVERVGRPHDRWHYSNIVYAVLGRLVATLDKQPWSESLHTRLLAPLGMTRTTVGFDDGPRVTGYFVPPYSDVPRAEPVLDLRAMAPVGGLASTARDLARWTAFIADPDPEVLAPDTLEEMCQPQVLRDTDGWTGAMGLGLFLVRASSGRIWVGHDGGMPGHSTAQYTHRESGTGAIALLGSTSGASPTALAVDLGERVVADVPKDEGPWRAGTEVPQELAGIIGRWYSEGQPFAFSVRRGSLEARLEVPAMAGKPPSVFAQESTDVYRTVSGRERGEVLRVSRDDAGRVTRLHWATYLFTREPLGFGEHLDRR